MRTLNMSQLIHLLLSVLLVALVSCGAPTTPMLIPTDTLAPPTDVPLPTAVSSSTPSPELPTDMPTLTLTPVPLPNTLTPTLIPPTLTPTLAPTMTDNEELAFVSEKLQYAAECRLPCWWGFIPGNTSLETTKIFFASQGVQIWGYGDPQDYTVVFDIPGHYRSSQNYIGRDSLLEMISVIAVPPEGEDGYPAYDAPEFVAGWDAYMLPQVLKAYGSPQQIFLETFNEILALPFRLMLFYPDQGFLVMYECPIGDAGQHFRTLEAINAGEPIRICPWRSGVAFLLLFPPNHELSFETLGPTISSMVNLEQVNSLEEATGMSIEQFVQTFQQSGIQACLETPAELW